MAERGLTVDQWRYRSQRYRLQGGRCRDCGRAFYPHLKSCPYCSSRSTEALELPRSGRLEAFTILYSVERGARGESPVVVGLVDLGVSRVISEIVDADPGSLKSGIPVEAVFRRLSADGDEGVIVYGIKFRPLMVGRADENGGQ